MENSRQEDAGALLSPALPSHTASQDRSSLTPAPSAQARTGGFPGRGRSARLTLVPRLGGSRGAERGFSALRPQLASAGWAVLPCLGLR